MSRIVRFLTAFFMFSSVGWIFIVTVIDSKIKWSKRTERESGFITGVITGYEKSESRLTGSKHTYPVVRFSVMGHTYELKSDNEMSPEEFPPGSSVDVLYDPNDHEKFHLGQYMLEGTSNKKLLKAGVIWILAALLLTALLDGLSDGWITDIGSMFRYIRWRLLRMFR